MDDAAQVPGQAEQVDELDLTFLSAANATFIAEMNAAWRRDPSAVDRRWATYFERLNALGESSVEVDQGPSWARNESRIVGAVDPADSVNAVAAGHAAGRHMNAGDMRAATLDSLRAVMLIRAYRVRGHLLADLDRGRLGVLEVLDERDVLGHVALGVGELLEDAVLELGHLDLEAVLLRDEVHLLLGEIWPFEGDDRREQLRAKLTWCKTGVSGMREGGGRG